MVKVNLDNLKGEILKIQKNENKQLLSVENTLFSINDIPKINLSEDESINNFLTQEYINFLNIGSFTALGFGRLFEQVAEKLQKIDGEVTYCKFLELIGTNRMTALRYRRRYKLYESVKGDNKKLVLLLRDDLIAKLYATKDLLGVAGYIEDGATKEDLEDFVLESKEIPTKNFIKKENIFNFLDFKVKILDNFERKVERLDSNKKYEIEKYLKKIEKLLEE